MIVLFDGSLFSSVLQVLSILLSISLALSVLRLFIGPDIPDRTVAFDLISIHAVGIIVLYAIEANAPNFLDIAIVTTVLGFLGTVMFARYLEQSGQE